jgi:beta-lactamase superfamily II metal-dependent hydrolase
MTSLNDGEEIALKKSIFMLLALLLLIPTLPAQAATYKDVPASFWAYNEIQQLSDKGILKGKPDGRFDPNGNVTRGQFALILYRALKLPAGTHAFPDVPKQGELADAVGAVVSAGIAKGYANGKFGPNDPITRGQMAVMVANAMGLHDEVEQAKSKPWPYADSVYEGHRNYAIVMKEHGIITGSGGQFKGGAHTTRAQTAAIIVRMLEKMNGAPAPSQPEAGNVEVHFIDVGQGDAIYISLPNNIDVLIDGGNNQYGDDVVNYLRAQNVDDIEFMIATHPDADHIGGLDVVLEAFDVENVYAPKVSHTTQTYEDFLLAVKNEGLTIKEAKASVEILNTYTCMALGCPPATSLVFVAPVKEYGNNLNNWSAVVRLDYGSVSFLFTGDAEEQAEKDMIAAGQNIRNVDVLKVGHHGSDTSTSQAFLDAVNPDYAVISVGKGNTYGHPSPTVLNRLASAGVKVYRTDESGTIVATSDGITITFNKSPSSTKHSPAPAPVANLVISELDLVKEKVTIRNNGIKDVSMTGWTLVSEEGNQTYEFPDGFVLKSRSSVNVWSGPNAINKPPTDLKWTGSYIWNNDGDAAALYDANGKLVHRVSK